MENLLKLLAMLAFFNFMSLDLDAQFFRLRERDRFNIQADGYWMKGKCVIPAARFGLADDGAIFRDVKVIVKNRRGKRRPRRRRADVNIRLFFFGERNGTIELVGTDTRVCTNVRRCKYRTRRIVLEQSIVGENIEIVGMIACIQGWREGGRITLFNCRVGTVPRNFQCTPGRTGLI